MRTVLSAGRMVAGPGGRVVPDGAVLCDGGLIVAVGPRAEVEAQAGPGVPRLAFPEGTLLPGLIDSHVHLALDAGPDPVAGLQAASDAELHAAMADRAGRLLA
ncbi:hypothetical protein Snoj_43480 [Streptomyces nojiriensis]|uniref:Aminodeoxyfutalosine deaminase/Imidazolonepropionase-like composite domain-containing protein n=1 Tax=Streptomyces nojiriensis TaxID=66374 RepID=A0ABQ3SQK1_9ACTN|nr:hypothetical protein GCM10010205_12140 [Streptomyces nojiriensis]GHI70430.1 hypothetical protein Snoj_43480 [Streptomyces nojiriensis]